MTFHQYKDPDIPENNGLQNKDLIVWMRTAALPNRRVNHTLTLVGSRQGTTDWTPHRVRLASFAFTLIKKSA